MCGIAGVVSPGRSAGQLSAIVAAQLRLQHHRGPDASGSFSDDEAVIGQNRLAVIDIDGGDPPIVNETGSIAAVLNGEIYNFRHLRNTLESEGHNFRTRCDTEVIAHLAEEGDAASIARALDGMFAFATWDKRRRRLLLGRDRLGKKPLYYWHGSGKLVFASEIKGVLAHPDVPRQLEEGAIPAHLTFGYVPTPNTFFSGIHSIPPGHVLTFEPGGEPQLARYWDLPAVDIPRDALSLRDAAHEVRYSLERAIEKRLVSDVPVGAFLSGGIDSSAVVALMARLSRHPVKTFTIGFDDADGFDERPFARLVAERYGTEHHEFVVSPRAVDLVESLVSLHDQPFGDSSAIPTFLLNQLTKDHVTVALCGDGGDELFAGYERFAAALGVSYYTAVPQRIRGLGTFGLSHLPRHWLSGRVGSIQRFGAAAEKGLPAAYLEWVSYIDQSTRAGLVGVASERKTSADFARLWSGARGNVLLDRVLDVNLRSYLLDDLLVKADRMSMAHGLEVRSPFLDTSLLELTSRLPAHFKIGGLRLKRVLKLAIKDVVPREIVSRGKRGFGVPLDRWFRTDLRPYMEAMLGSHAAVRAHVSGDVVDRIVAEHVRGTRNRGHALWCLLTLEVFLRREGW